MPFFYPLFRLSHAITKFHLYTKTSISKFIVAYTHIPVADTMTIYVFIYIERGTQFPKSLPFLMKIICRHLPIAVIFSLGSLLLILLTFLLLDRRNEIYCFIFLNEYRIASQITCCLCQLIVSQCLDVIQFAGLYLKILASHTILLEKHRFLCAN